MSNLRKFADNYHWSGLEFPIAINKIGIFERKNDISITILTLKGPEVFIARMSECKFSKNINLLLITNGKRRHYTVIKKFEQVARK